MLNVSTSIRGLTHQLWHYRTLTANEAMKWNVLWLIKWFVWAPATHLEKGVWSRTPPAAVVFNYLISYFPSHLQRIQRDHIYHVNMLYCAFKMCLLVIKEGRSFFFSLWYIFRVWGDYVLKTFIIIHLTLFGTTWIWRYANEWAGQIHRALWHHKLRPERKYPAFPSTQFQIIQHFMNLWSE